MPDATSQLGFPGSSRPETLPMHLSPPNANNSISLFQNAQNVYMRNPTFIVANSVHNVSNADGNDYSAARIWSILTEKLLPRAQFAEYDAASPAPRNACTENTRRAILDTLRAWASDETTTKVYWLNGMAGTGKTTIAYSFSEILDEDNCLGGTFFSSHLRVDTSDVRCIIPTISLQLAKYLPSLPQLILNVVEANPDCSSWRISKQFLNFIIRPLTSAYRDTREVAVPVVVLDALDECSNQSLVAELLSVILKHSKSLPVKFFITSRPEIVLKETFDKSWAHLNFILHEVEKEIVKADIELYIKVCLLNGHIWHDWPPQAEVERLVNMSGTLFIYAATVCKYIAQRGSLSMPERLSDVIKFTSDTKFGVTQPLDVLYKRILDAAYDTTNPREQLDISMVLKTVAYVFNPLSITAISILVQISMKRVEAALSSLHSLIYIPSPQHSVRHISIFHASFYDFISNQTLLSSRHHLDPCVSHKSLALLCLSLMDKEWSEEKSVSYLVERRDGEISEPLAYACASWAFHFTHADNTSGYAELKHFFERHLLQWMDCLSILGNLRSAIDSLSRLENWANTQKLFVMTVIDAKQFLKENFEFIKNNSLEGCPSALAWLPESSYIWKIYGSRMECPWKLCLGRRKAWSLCEAVLRHSGGVEFAMFSSDGMHIVSACSDQAQIWNTVTGECEVELKGHSNWINSAVFSPDGMHIVSASKDHTAWIWNTVTGECEAILKGHSSGVNSAVFSPDGMHIVTTSNDKTVCIWNSATGECEAELKGHSKWVTSAVFSPDGMHIVSASKDYTARIWNTATGNCEAELKGHFKEIFSVAFSPDSMHVVSASADNTACIWNIATGKCEAQLKGHSKWVKSAVFSSDGMHVVSASYDCTVRVWNTATGQCEAELQGHSNWVKSAVFSPDGRHIVSASYDHTARIWNTATGVCEAELKGHSNWVNSAVFSPNGTHIVTASNDHTARIWNTTMRDFEAELKGHSNLIKSSVFSVDGMHVVSASYDHTARIWNTATGVCEAELKGHSDLVNSAVFSPDGMHIVSASDDKTARIWSTATGECEAELKGHPDGVRSAVFSPNGMHIMTIPGGKTVWIWNTAAGHCEAKLKGHSDWVNSAVFSPDGMHIVSASYDCTARLWSTAGDCEAELKGHSNWVNSAVFSPDGIHIVTASNDHTARIWNTATRECEAELKGHQELVKFALFSPDGVHVMSASADKTVRIWNMVTGECERELRVHTSIPSLYDTSQLHVVSSISDDFIIHNGPNDDFYASFKSSFLNIIKDTIFHTINYHTIWIPPPFHNPSSISYHLSKVCLGYESGELLLLEFNSLKLLADD